MDIEVTKDISSIKSMLEELSREQRLTNALLRAMIKDNDASFDLPQDHRICTDKSFSVIYPDYLQVKEWLTEIALRDRKKVKEFNGESLSFLETAITSLNQGDYLLVRNDDLIRLPSSIEVILTAYDKGTIEIVIGKGEQALKMDSDIPRVNYVIWSDIEQLIPIKISDAFPIVNR